MKHWRLCCLGTVCVLLVSSTAEAGPVWSVSSQSPLSFFVSDTGRTLLPMTGLTSTSTTLGATVQVDHIGVTTRAPDSRPDHFTHQNYRVGIVLRDLSNHLSQTLWFAGYIDGTVSKSHTALVNHFYSPSTMSNIHLGSDVFTVSIGPFANPGPGGNPLGALDVHVAEVIAQPKPSASAAPMLGAAALRVSAAVVSETAEPSSILLAGAGASLVGLFVWLRCRRTALPFA
jgi:hypothetical protein